MNEKTVVIVEDEYAIRERLHNALVRRGFQVVSAATASQARSTFEKLGDRIDVGVLDMRLQDPAELETTGADIGIEMQRKHPGWLPEFLIYSAFAEVNYYKLALQLGVASYLSKDEYDAQDVVRHVRALALKRALRPERSEVGELIKSISESTRNLSEAVRKFCNILTGELDACLGAPYILLLTGEGKTQNLFTNTDLPTGDEQIYTTLQAMAHGQSNVSTPYVINRQQMRNLPSPANRIEAHVYERLPGAAFVPLANVKDFRLSLGVLTGSEETHPSDEPCKLATVLAQYVRSTVVEHFLRILIQLDARRRTMLVNTSQLCLFVGQDQQGVIAGGITLGDLKEDTVTHAKLEVMAEDLKETGEILADIALGQPEGGLDEIDMREVLDTAWSDVSRKMGVGELRAELRGTCIVRAHRTDMLIAVTRLLQWLVQRRIETDPDVEPGIRVLCTQGEDGAQVCFEDNSNRLPELLRRHLFSPFSLSVAPPIGGHLRGPGLYLPLYLAKMLVEEKYGGWLDDRSDEMQTAFGHRLVMRFAPGEEAPFQGGLHSRPADPQRAHR